MAPMRAFLVLQKWPKIAKMTPNDLLTLKMVFTEPLIILFDLERKSEFHGNIATYRYTLYRLEPYRT